jgi:hypothetical protein
LFEDIIGCSTQATGTFNCDCETQSGTMSSTPLIVCAENGSVTATYNNDGTFDADDAGTYVLHTGSSNFLGTVLEINLQVHSPTTLPGKPTQHIIFLMLLEMKSAVQSILPTLASVLLPANR